MHPNLALKFGCNHYKKNMAEAEGLPHNISLLQLLTDGFLWWEMAIHEIVPVVSGALSVPLTIFLRLKDAHQNASQKVFIEKSS